jgi:hypothetical protein
MDMGDDLFNSDIYIEILEGWWYLVDRNHDIVYVMDNYGWNGMDILNKNGWVKFPIGGTLDDYDLNNDNELNEQLVNPGKKKNIKIYGDYPNGIWTKEQYDDDGNLIYFENYLGYWSKREYDENNNRVYHETSSGKIIDKRNKIQE